MRNNLVARLPSSRHVDVVYEVRLEGATYTCTCPGFGFRKSCRHVTALTALKALPVDQESGRPSEEELPASWLFP